MNQLMWQIPFLNTPSREKRSNVAGIFFFGKLVLIFVRTVRIIVLSTCDVKVKPATF